jgi:hypothetical protein
MKKITLFQLKNGNLIYIASAHFILTGALKLLRMSEQMRGDTSGPLHTLFNLSYFPSWPLFTKINDPAFATPAGQIANSFLFALVVIYIGSKLQGEAPPDNKDRSPQSILTRLLILSATTALILGIFSGLQYFLGRHCYTNQDPLSGLLTTLLLTVVALDPLQGHLGLCSAFQMYSDHFYSPLLIGVLVSYCWCATKELAGCSFQLFTSAQRYLSFVLVLSIVAFSVKGTPANPLPLSEIEMANEIRCTDEIFPTNLSADDASELLRNDVRKVIFTSMPPSPLLRREVFREHFKGEKGASKVKKLLKHCLIDRIKSSDLSSNGLTQALQNELTDVELGEQVTEILSLNDSFDTLIPSFLTMLTSQEQETRKRGGFGLQKAGLTGIQNLVSWNGKFGSAFLPDWYDFLDTFSIGNVEIIDFLVTALNTSHHQNQSVAARLLGGTGNEGKPKVVKALLARLLEQSAPTEAILHALTRIKVDISEHQDLFLSALEKIDIEQQVQLLREVVLESTSGFPPPGFVTRLLIRYASLLKESTFDSQCLLQTAFLGPKKVFIYGKSTPFDNFEVHLNILDRFGDKELDTLIPRALTEPDKIRGTILEFLWHTKLDISEYKGTLQQALTTDRSLEIQFLIAGLLNKLQSFDDSFLSVLRTNPKFQECMDAPLFAELLTRIGPSGGALLLGELDEKDTTNRGRLCERAQKLQELPLLASATIQPIFERLRRTPPNEGCAFSGMLHLIARSEDGPPEGAIDYLGSLVEGDQFRECITTPWASSVADTLLELRSQPKAVKYLLKASKQLAPGPFDVLVRNVRRNQDELSKEILSSLERIFREHQQHSFRRTEVIDKKAEGPVCPNREGEWVVPKSRSRLSYFITTGDLSAIKAHLKELPLDINKPDYRCVTPLIEAIKRKREDIVKELLLLGADTESPLPEEATPLMVAATFESKEIIKLLLAVGASPNRVSAYEETFLTRALSENLFTPQELTELISKYKIDINLGRDYFKGTPPMVTAYQQSGIDLVLKLHSLGGDLNQRDRQGNSLLNLAAQKNREDYLRIKELGADSQIPNCRGQIPEVFLNGEIRIGVTK